MFPWIIGIAVVGGAYLLLKKSDAPPSGTYVGPASQNYFNTLNAAYNTYSDAAAYGGGIEKAARVTLISVLVAVETNAMTDYGKGLLSEDGMAEITEIIAGIRESIGSAPSEMSGIGLNPATMILSTPPVVPTYPFSSANEGAFGVALAKAQAQSQYEAAAILRKLSSHL